MTTAVYLAGGFNSDWRETVTAELGDGFQFFNPIQHRLDEVPHYTAWDLHFIRKTDVLFGYMESTNPSGFGLTLEIGYAKGLGKTIVLVDERSGTDPTFGNYFAICHAVADVTFPAMRDGLDFMKSFQRGVT